MYMHPTRRSQLLFARRGLGDASSVMSSLSSGVRSTAMASIRGVTLRSNLSPDVALSSPLEVAGPAGGGVRRRGGFSEALLAFAKPEIEIETLAGRVTVAPWGPPTMNLFWPLVVLGVAGAISLGIVVVKGVRA